MTLSDALNQNGNGENPEQIHTKHAMLQQRGKMGLLFGGMSTGPLRRWKFKVTTLTWLQIGSFVLTFEFEVRLTQDPLLVDVPVDQDVDLHDDLLFRAVHAVIQSPKMLHDQGHCSGC